MRKNSFLPNLSNPVGIFRFKQQRHQIHQLERMRCDAIFFLLLSNTRRSMSDRARRPRLSLRPSTPLGCWAANRISLAMPTRQNVGTSRENSLLRTISTEPSREFPLRDFFWKGKTCSRTFWTLLEKFAQIQWDFLRENYVLVRFCVFD